MHGPEEQRVSSAAGTSVLRAAGLPERRIRELELAGRLVPVAHAMAVVTVARSLAAGGFSPQEIDAVFPALMESDLAQPQEHAEAVVGLARRLAQLELQQDAMAPLLLSVARRNTAKIAATADDVERAVRAGLAAGLAAATAADVVDGLLKQGSENLMEKAESAFARGAAEVVSRPHDVHSVPRNREPRARKGEEAMSESDRRNGCGPAASSERDRERERERLEREREALDRERERLDRERERADREREKLDREREKLDRLQEALEERVERQEERLQELEDELEERMEALDAAAEELEGLEDIEVDGIEGVREMLNVMSDRLPHLLRGIHESVYSPEQLQSTAGSFAAFYKTLVESGIPGDHAAQMTKHHFESLERQVRAQMEAPNPSRRGRSGRGDDFDPLGPNFDPLGPNFDPLARRGGGRRPPEPAEPAEPDEPRGD